jgi:hypothetical protein
MRRIVVMLAVLACSATARGQTAEELVAKNTEAKGGIDKIKAIKTLRLTGRVQQDDFTAQIGQEAKALNLLRQTFTIQGMTAVQAYDGTVGWQIQPFGGRKDPEVMGEDDLRDLVETADFYGPLIDAKEKGNTIEYLGRDTVDGDDAYKLKVTLKNGDFIYYFLDPDSGLEIRTEKHQFIRGSERATITDLGSYKQVMGVYFAYSIESGPKSNPAARTKVTVEKFEANVPIDDSVFKMPVTQSSKDAAREDLQS